MHVYVFMYHVQIYAIIIDLRCALYYLPNILDDLVQETRRVFRYGSLAEAVLYFRNKGNKASKAVKEYSASTSQCCRYLLFTEELMYMFLIEKIVRLCSLDLHMTSLNTQ